MIEIDFIVDEEQLTESLSEEGCEKIENEDYVSFLVTIFIMPVKMQVNNLEIFGYQDDIWSPMPIMNVASEGVLTIKSLKNSKQEEYQLMQEPGFFIFTMIDDNNVILRYEGLKTLQITVPYDELLNAFVKFAEKVRKFMKERVPQLNEHAYWGPWLRDERD